MISSLTYVFVAVVGYCPTGACLGQGRLVQMGAPFWRQIGRFVLRFDRGHASLGKSNHDCRCNAPAADVRSSSEGIP